MPLSDASDHAKVKSTYDGGPKHGTSPSNGKPAGHVNRQPLELPSEEHLRLYRLLRATARLDAAGQLVSWWPQTKLAAKLGVSVRKLRNLLADLREPGLDPRHPKGSPPGLRLGLIRVESTHYRDKATGQHRLGGNLYVLVYGHRQVVLGACQQARPATPVSAAQVNRQADPVACLNKGYNHQPRREGILQPVGGTTAAAPGDGVVPEAVEVEQLDPWPTDAVGRHVPVRLHARPGGELGHAPTATEILAAFQAGFGDVRVLEVRSTTPPTYRTMRGRVVDLAACSVEDLHRALDQLDRDTCNGGPCRPGATCTRHTRRRRVAA